MTVHFGSGAGISGMSISGTGTVYYVDATGGADGNDGRSPTDAWQTIGKVNGETFQRGDSILFKCGETWSLTVALTVPQDGLTFGAYGTGADPILDGQDTVNCVLGNAKNDISFSNIECTQGLDYGFYFNNEYNVHVRDCSAHDCGNDQLIFQNNTRFSSVRGGTFYNAYRRVAGPMPTGIEVSDGSHDITIADCTCRDNGSVASEGCGIFISSHAATAMPFNVTIDNVACTGNNLAGLYVLKQDATANADSNIAITDSSFNDNDDYGIRVTYGGAATVRGITVTDCRCIDNADYGTYCKGRDITFTRVLVATIVAGLGAVRFEDCVDPTVTNCTFYKGFDAPAGDQEALRTFGASMDGFTMRSSIVSNQVAGTATIQVVNVGTNFDIDYTLYEQGQANDLVWLGAWYTFANWKSNTSMDANSPTPADPLFTNPAVEDFTLQAGSPARGAGEGGVDCGAYPYTG